MSSFSPEYMNTETDAIAKEFQRVIDKTYLDHAGATLYTEKQVEAIAKLLNGNLFGNPHTCKVTGDLVDQVRYRILKHFNADSSEYAVVFTANATAALKAVAECFKFRSNENETAGSFYYCQENHTSVLGMRDLVQTSQQFVLTKDELVKNAELAATPSMNPTSSSSNSLVAFSAQCNFSGFKMPLEIIESIQKNGLVCRGTQIRRLSGKNVSAESKDDSNFYVCLDTASFVASNYFDLQRYKPDFCCVSFYKIFGFPTGVGALIVSKRGQLSLEKKYYGGGTVKIAMTRQNFHEKRQGFTERFEDGTLAFLSIASLLEGFRTLDRLIPATPQRSQMQRISNHVFQLAKYCHDELAQLRHANGAPLIKFYNHTGYKSSRNQGGIVTFNVLQDDGTFVGFAEVACIAAVHNVQLRTGCFCNPGACQHFLQLSDLDIRKRFEAGHVCSDFNDLYDVLPTGAVRLSFGYMTRIEDVQKAVIMIRECYLTTAAQRLQLLDAQAENLPQVLQRIPQRLRPQLKRICIYPVKFCGSYVVSGKWELTRAGFKYDCTWIIVDSNGMELTQEDSPRLCLLKPHIHLEKAQLELSFPEMKNIILPLEIDASKRMDSTNLQSSDEFMDCGDAVAAWLTKCLEINGLRMLRCEDRTFVKKGQFLLINRTTVRRLTNAMETECESFDHTLDRFRANFVIETAEALEENTFEEVIIGDVAFKVIDFCRDSNMICIDQHNGEKTLEPLQTIERIFGETHNFGVYLAVNEVLTENCVIASNDIMKITKRKE